jgi:methyl-accepting chemotaxis protein
MNDNGDNGDNEYLDHLLTTLHAAEEGDLTARARAGQGPLGDVAGALNRLLGSLEARATKIAFAATSILVAAESTASALSEVADGMSRQQAAVAEIARKLKSLEARSEEVGQIVEMLDDVASETNILSLNAAIEASRAGAQGKGFGLVAEEVRKMAERAASATKDIGAYLETLSGATSDATRAIESVRTSADDLALLTSRMTSDPNARSGMRKRLSEALGPLHFSTLGEAEVTKVLHEQRDELLRVLGPLTPLIAETTTPLGEALRNVLAALGESTARTKKG